MATSQSTIVSPSVEYRDIPGCPGYRIGNDGTVLTRKRNRKERVLRCCRNNHGYMRAILVLNGKRRYRSVHSLVLLAFVGPRPEGAVTRHLNNDKTDNRLANLVYGTQKENNDDKKRHGTEQVGMKCPAAVLTDDDVRDVITALLKGKQLKVIAERYGMDDGTIAHIRDGRSWWLICPEVARPILPSAAALAAVEFATAVENPGQQFRYAIRALLAVSRPLTTAAIVTAIGEPIRDIDRILQHKWFLRISVPQRPAKWTLTESGRCGAW
jgi:hypothetical protein